MRTSLLGSCLLLSAVFGASVASAQSPTPGLRMYAAVTSTDTILVDEFGQTVHTWASTVTPGVSAYMEADGTLLRTYAIPGGPAVAGRGGGLQRIAFDGTVTWDFQVANAQRWAHIDVEPLPNGNVLMIVWERLTVADAVAAGRDPSTLLGAGWLPDVIIEVQQTGPTSGQVVWEWKFMDHVIQDFDPTKANFGVVGDHPELLDINWPPRTFPGDEWNHCNAIDYDPTNDIILLNSPFQNELWLIDHSTTTAEAAGHSGGNFGMGGDLLYRWGNPQAYRRGTAADQKLFFQHGTKFVEAGLPGAGNIIIFNNRAGSPQMMNFSTVVEMQLPASFALAPGQAYGPTDFLNEYTDPVPTDLYSALMSSVDRLPNGNTLVSSAQQGGYTFELDPTFTTKSAEFTPFAAGTLVFRCDYLGERFVFADAQEISLSAGGTVQFDTVAGSGSDSDLFLLIGSASGTSPGFQAGGLDLPLNFDGYLETTVGFANRGPFGNTEGTLDNLGRATSTFTLPAGILPPAAIGTELHHTVVAYDPATQQFTKVSSPLPLLWTQ